MELKLTTESNSCIESKHLDSKKHPCPHSWEREATGQRRVNWANDCPFKLAFESHLPPAGGDSLSSLTVTLWMERDPGPPQKCSQSGRISWAFVHDLKIDVYCNTSTMRQSILVSWLWTWNYIIKKKHYLKHCWEMSYCFIIQTTANQHIGNSCGKKKYKKIKGQKKGSQTRISNENALLNLKKGSSKDQKQSKKP